MQRRAVHRDSEITVPLLEHGRDVHAQFEGRCATPFVFPFARELREYPASSSVRPLQRGRAHLSPGRGPFPLSFPALAASSRSKPVSRSERLASRTPSSTSPQPAGGHRNRSLPVQTVSESGRLPDPASARYSRAYCRGARPGGTPCDVNVSYGWDLFPVRGQIERWPSVLGPVRLANSIVARLSSASLPLSTRTLSAALS